LVEVVATGELTFNGVTITVQIALQAQLVDGAISVAGSTEILFADCGVTLPSAPVVVSVKDHGILEEYYAGSTLPRTSETFHFDSWRHADTIRRP
jgi:hypothetical protein